MHTFKTPLNDDRKRPHLALDRAFASFAPATPSHHAGEGHLERPTSTKTVALLEARGSDGATTFAAAQPGAKRTVATEVSERRSPSRLALGVLAFFCVLAGLLLWTALPSYGTKPIEDIRPGDQVLSRDEHGTAQAPKRVVEKFTFTADHLYHVTVRSSDGAEQTLHVTAEHPFHVPGRGWVKVKDLSVGDRLVHDDGQKATVAGIVYEARPEGAEVHNIEVEGFHTYFVSQGSRPIWVHNKPVEGNPNAVPPAPPPPRLKGLGNIGSHGPVDPDVALRAATKWLGAGYREIAPGVYRSADGLRQFRMTTADLTATHGNIGPHVHFEALDTLGQVIENLHLPILP